MSNEPVIRVAFFLAVFVVVAAWEAMAPRRARWPANLGIVALNTALVRLLLPTTAVAFALLGEQRGWGLLNNLDLPRGAAVVLAVLALDLAIYLQHVLFHAVPLLWRLHRMHHADLDIDVTTGARFHPIEIAASMVLKLAAIAALDVWSRDLMEHCFPGNGRMRYGPGSSRLRHDDRGCPSSDTT
ncbi:MAG: hypothetical protein BGN99_24980 [Alphaproteobacteria bacterium 65-37]|nr:MAG: hypothetical protein BGN99_24980 [Alphaproteobacteria bacterium 65-37]